MQKIPQSLLIAIPLALFALTPGPANAVTLDFEDGTAFFSVENTADIFFQNAVYVDAPTGEPDFVDFGSLGMGQDSPLTGQIIMDFVRPIIAVSLDVVVGGNAGIRLSPLDFQFLPDPPPTIDYFRVGDEVQFVAPNNLMPPQVRTRLTVTGDNMTRLTITPHGPSMATPDVDNFEITFVPIPAALPLLASALAGIGCFAFTRRNIRL